MKNSTIKTSLTGILFITFLLCLSGHIIQAQQDSSAAKKLKFFADTRIRVEHDWNVRRSNDELKDERTRMRFRFRFGFDYQWSDQVRFGARMRSGVPEDQQSPHWTLGKEFEVYSFKIDRVYLAGKHGNFWWWAGKKNYPFWKQNELFWDDDVMPEGVSLGTSIGIGEKAMIKPIGGIFISKSAGSFFDNDGIIYAGQFEFNQQLEKANFTLASGLFYFKNLNDLNQKPLELKLDYNLWMSSIQLQLKRKMPMRIGLDLVYNLEDCSNTPWISEAEMEDEKLGYVASFSIGALKEKGQVQFGYSYAHIEKYSVVDYFAQDDWVSWSFPDNTPGTRSSNFKGHEFQAAYSFGKGFNVVTRLYLVDGIKKNMPTDASIESADRFRVDFNIGF